MQQVEAASDYGGLAFPALEFESRIKSIKEKMSQSNLELLVLSRPESIFYCCGYRASWIASWASEFTTLVVPLDADPRLFIRALEKKTARFQASKDPYVYADQDGPWSGLAGFLQGLGRSKVGIEERFLSVAQFEKLKKILHSSRFEDVTPLVNRVMASPSQLEVEFTRRAAEITNRGFARGIELCRTGTHLYEIMAEIESSMYKAGQTEQNRSLCLLWTGEGGGAMHDTDLTKRVSSGDLITLEVWGTWKHYRAGAQGTLYAGDNPPKEIVETYDLVSRMYVGAREAMRAGGTAAEAFEGANREFKNRYGYDYYRRVGGLMGLAPMIVNLAIGNATRFEEGQTYLVQPQTNEPLLITVCGSLLVKNGGVEELCKPLLQLTKI